MKCYCRACILKTQGNTNFTENKNQVAIINHQKSYPMITSRHQKLLHTA